MLDHEPCRSARLVGRHHESSALTTKFSQSIPDSDSKKGAGQARLGVDLVESSPSQSVNLGIDATVQATGGDPVNESVDASAYGVSHEFPARGRSSCFIRRGHSREVESFDRIDEGSVEIEQERGMEHGRTPSRGRREFTSNSVKALDHVSHRGRPIAPGDLDAFRDQLRKGPGQARDHFIQRRRPRHSIRRRFAARRMSWRTSIASRASRTR